MRMKYPEILLHPRVHVQDPLLADWIPMKQPPAAEAIRGLALDRRFEYDDKDNVIYRGYHLELGADTSDGQWSITLYEWDGKDNMIRQRGPVLGAWDDREILDWGV